MHTKVTREVNPVVCVRLVDRAPRPQASSRAHCTFNLLAVILSPLNFARSSFYTQPCFILPFLELMHQVKLNCALGLVNCSLFCRHAGVRQQLLEEISIIKMAGPHPHLVGLLGYCTLGNDPVCLLLEYMEGGDLLGYLHRIRDSCVGGTDEGKILGILRVKFTRWRYSSVISVAKIGTLINFN